MNIKNIDLNLLAVLDSLLATGSVTRAAAQAGITQPAMSNALGRLRRSFGDPLFVRSGRNLVPTPRALLLRPALARALADLQSSVDIGLAFDPATARTTLRVAFSDYWHLALLPRLVARIEREAPGVQLQASPVGEHVLADDIPRGAVDAAIFLSPTTLPGMHCETFVNDTYVCVARRDHPIVRTELTLERFAACRQVVVTPQGPWASHLHEAMHRRGLAPQSVLATPHIQVALDIIARTDYLSVLPRQVARQARGKKPLRVWPCPVPTGSFSLGLYWHESTDQSLPHRWFRDLLLTDARAVYAGR